MKLPLAYYGNPILRKAALPVDAITPEILKLINDMEDTMKAHRGQGIAAPQVGRSLAIFIISIPNIRENYSLEYGKSQVFINPKLSDPSVETIVEPEACLSLPKVYGEVQRPEKITITYQDITGKTVQETYSGEYARVIMHEHDHLKGVLFIDRLKKAERKAIEDALNKIKKQYN